MSDEQTELVQRLMKAWGKWDIETIVSCFHPDAELLLLRSFVEGDSYRGHDGVRRAVADARETWEAFQVEIGEFRTISDGLIGLGRTVVVGKSDAPTVEFQSAYLVKFRDGKVVYLRPYQSHRAALEAAGLTK